MSGFFVVAHLIVNSTGYSKTLLQRTFLPIVSPCCFQTCPYVRFLCCCTSHCKQQGVHKTLLQGTFLSIVSLCCFQACLSGLYIRLEVPLLLQIAFSFRLSFRICINRWLKFITLNTFCVGSRDPQRNSIQRTFLSIVSSCCFQACPYARFLCCCASLIVNSRGCGKTLLQGTFLSIVSPCCFQSCWSGLCDLRFLYCCKLHSHSE